MREPGYIKSACHNWVLDALAAQAKKRGIWHHTNVVMGLACGRARKWMDEGRDFIYLDHAYFNRGWAHNNFRAVRNGVHLNMIKPRPPDRLERFGITVEPWRKTGTKIVIIPPSPFHVDIWPHLKTYVETTKQRLAEVTDRPIYVKAEKGGLRQCLADAWALVCPASVAGVEAALMGVPVFSSPMCPSAPVSAGSIDDIENPLLVDNRKEWAASLAYASWNASEIDDIDWLEYDYQMRHDMPS